MVKSSSGFDRAGSSAVAIYASDGYEMNHSIGIGITFKGIAVFFDCLGFFFFDIQLYWKVTDCVVSLTCRGNKAQTAHDVLVNDPFVSLRSRWSPPPVIL